MNLQRDSLNRFLHLGEMKDLSKSKMGELLRGSKGTPSANANFAQNFIDRGESLDINQLQRISEFFNKPLEYFLYGEGYQVMKVQNNSGIIQQGNSGVITAENNSSSKIEQIRELKEMGFSPEQILEALK